jgi:hypothetical protein
MAISPNKQRTLSRQPSHPSLAIGLPPALPESHNMMPSSSSSRLLDGSKTQPRKRDNLQARLQAAAKLQKSRSQGEGLNDSPSIGHLVPKVKPEMLAKSTSGVINGGSSNGSKDKVVVCVRYVICLGDNDVSLIR